MSRALVSDANGKVAVSTTTSTELGHVSGVTSAIQTQLDGKQSTLTFDPPSSNNDNPSKSSQIKTALDLKANLAGPSFTGDVTFDTTTLKIDSTNNRIGIGTYLTNTRVSIVGNSGILRTLLFEILQQQRLDFCICK